MNFTPTSFSWLNLIERWFRELTDKALRRGAFHSVPDVIARIEEYLDAHNDTRNRSSGVPPPKTSRPRSPADALPPSSQSMTRHTTSCGDLDGGLVLLRNRARGSRSRRTLLVMSEPDADPVEKLDEARRDERAQRDEHIAEDAALADRLAEALDFGPVEHDPSDPN
jgi:hypothetical protein